MCALDAVHHVQLTVTPADEAATLDFYRRVLRLPEIPKPEPLRKNGGAWFQLRGFEIHVSREAGELANAASKRHVCFQVSDLAATQTALEAAGVTILPDREPIAAWRRFYIRDPGGNRIEFAEMTPGLPSG